MRQCHELFEEVITVLRDFLKSLVTGIIFFRTGVSGRYEVGHALE